MTDSVDLADCSPLRTIYGALRADEVWAQAVSEWRSHREAMSGPFERKRMVGRKALSRILGVPEREVDLVRYLYAVELWVLFLAQGRLRNCIESLRESGSPARCPGDLQIPSLGAGAEDLDRLAARLTFGDVMSQPSGENPAHDFGCHIERLVPKQIRHTTGAYFTPSWLADELVEQVLTRSDGQHTDAQRFLEPSCGPGVFLCSLVRSLVQRDLIDARADLAANGTLIAYEFNDLWAFVAQVSLLELQVSLARTNGLALQDLSWHRCVLVRDFLEDAIDRELRGPAESRQLNLLESASASTDQAVDERFDVILGNPPWINWEHLPSDYRLRIRDLWPRLGIFDLKALEKANSKEDVASLFTVAALHLFGTDTATIGFVLPQSLLQSSLLGKGLRTVIAREDTAINVLRVDEWTALRPFGGAANNTISIVATNRGQTRFPVEWFRHSAGAEPDALLSTPISAETGASWLAAESSELSMLDRVKGPNAYRGRTGVFTGGANAVYYVEPLAVETSGSVRIRNVVERAKRSARSVEATIEPDYLYPVVTGRDVSFWGFECSKHLICPHTSETRMSAVNPEVLKKTAPQTLAYLDSFADVLAERKGFAGWERARLEEAFYAIQRIGDYSFAPFKVSWKYISSTFVVAVVREVETTYRGVVPPLVNDKVMSIGLWNEQEAYFVCALLSAYPFRHFVESHMVSTQISPSVIKNLCLPLFDPTNRLHLDLSALCREGHEHVACSNTELAQKCISEVSSLAFQVLGISDIPDSSRSDAPIR